MHTSSGWIPSAHSLVRNSFSPPLTTRKTHLVSILFVDGDTETLIDRYREHNRNLPLIQRNISLKKAYGKERDMLQSLRKHADILLSGSGHNGRDLSARLENPLSDEHHTRKLLIDAISFGFKHGISKESDHIFAVRFLK